MRRRDLIILVFNTAVTWQLSARTQRAQAQLPKKPMIGVLSPFIDADSTFLRDVRDSLADRGLREGKEIGIEYRSAEGRIDRLPLLADEFVRLKVAIIVTASAPAIRFVQRATQTVPIVMAQVGDAADQGFVANLAHPGRNITGTSWFEPELSAKRLELLKEALPETARVAILREASAGAASVTAVQTAARRLGILASVFEVREPDEFPTALSAMADAGVQGVEILEGLMISNSVHLLVALAKGHRFATIFADSSFVEAGGLMSYGPDLSEIYRRTAEIIEKILKGALPGDIPVEQPTKFAFAINLKTAKALGLTIPPPLVMRADFVIE
ncbi:putative ABC transport system substrate-binding protein [Bradyrhizobium sp. Rc2d]|uniref:ABC transporter substrate-binding protein n=1 Tax=Bradyrhizobium sp. Rc2d TaxID=1855321 RepID=UPI00088CB6E1|nr:ABC transporter substrate-binding protein [Bradyrhizobium sp. Rc2d]SDK04535.1 putative ABC transport system substrate-binding protein [Bradyrhizobium sp. Rc2d]